MIGVDISESARTCAEELAKRLNVASNCTFLAENLEQLSVEDNSVDFIIGHGALHHFIKYNGVPAEFLRIMKVNAEGFFADAFGENKFYHLFHDKEKMERLGDVSLSKQLVSDYFSDFEVKLLPVDWFVMLDKLYQKILPKPFNPAIRKLSKLHFHLDRKMPETRLTLYLSGSVLTSIRKV